jgi:ferritin-like metal-binding protein YciE
MNEGYLMALNTLEDLLVHELQDLYDAEHQLTKALPKMAEEASSSELKNGFNTHLKETENQIKRLEQVFQAMGQKAERKTCQAMQGLIKEANETIKEKMSDDVKDAALIASAQRVEHYEIAGYGTARTFAEVLGMNEVAKMLQQTLDEESATDEKLNKVAKTINREATK